MVFRILEARPHVRVRGSRARSVILIPNPGMAPGVWTLHPGPGTQTQTQIRDPVRVIRVPGAARNIAYRFRIRELGSRGFEIETRVRWWIPAL